MVLLLLIVTLTNNCRKRKNSQSLKAEYEALLTIYCKHSSNPSRRLTLAAARPSRWRIHLPAPSSTSAWRQTQKRKYKMFIINDLSKVAQKLINSNQGTLPALEVPNLNWSLFRLNWSAIRLVNSSGGSEGPPRGPEVSYLETSSISSLCCPPDNLANTPMLTHQVRFPWWPHIRTNECVCCRNKAHMYTSQPQ